jgi:hypothetical protein
MAILGRLGGRRNWRIGNAIGGEYWRERLRVRHNQAGEAA